MSTEDPRPRHQERETRGAPDDALLDQLRAANEQLVVNSMRAQELADEANVSRANAEIANQLKDEFLAIVSHELRTPLNAILAWARLLGSGRLDAARTTTAIQTVERNAKALALIIDDLLDVSRIARGKVTLDPTPVDLVAVIAGALDEVRLAAEAKAVTVVFARETLRSLVAGDLHRMQQVVVNLLSNAIKFTPSGRRVEVRLTSTASQAEIWVTDTGEGIAPEFLPHLFNRFAQGDTSTTRRHGGIGLGLAIVKGIVELHGGTVHADSPGPGKGAVFTVRIPLLPPHEPKGVADTPADEPRLDGVTVLLAEDDADGRKVLTTILELAGAKVAATGSAREALSAFGDIRPDVLVSDIGMADVDGYALIRKIRAREATNGRTTPAIAVTGFASPADRTRMLAAGYQMHLKKPVEPSDLVAAVASLVPRAA